MHLLRDVSRFPHPVCNVHSLGRGQRLWQLAVRGSATIDLIPTEDVCCERWSPFP